MTDNGRSLYGIKTYRLLSITLKPHWPVKLVSPQWNGLGALDIASICPVLLKMQPMIS